MFSRLPIPLTLLFLALPYPASAQFGNCAPAEAEAYLDANNVRARIFNNGNLFWRGSPAVYEVAKGGGVSSLFFAGLTVAGLVNDELRAALGRYSNTGFWPGPIDEVTGAPPGDCSSFDRIYSLTRRDLEAFDRGEDPIADLAEWPTGLGAPTLDTDNTLIDVTSLPLGQRVKRVIDLAAGERPQLIGDQMTWSVFNDVGNDYSPAATDPLRIEVHSTAFAYDVPGPIGNTTFYRYRLVYRGEAELDSAYVGLFVDPDLGHFDDDYIGVDTTLGLAYTYNADNDDEGAYGTAPPAVGVDFVRGFETGNAKDPAAFVYYFVHMWFEGSFGSAYYNFLRGRTWDGQQIRHGVHGDTTAAVTTLMYPGDPVVRAFWSEFNTDGSGSTNPPADRRFMVSKGPFSMQPGER